jgi:hypothetical protein
MDRETLEKSQKLLDKINQYQTNLNTFQNKNMHQDNKKREGFNIGRVIKGWAIERTERGKSGLKTSYEGGGYEFIGYLNLDEEDMQYIQGYLEVKYKKLCEDFEEL